MIKFNEDKIFENKTHKYLYPLLSIYGQEFCARFNKLFKLGIFIGDLNYYCMKPCLYIVIKVPVENHSISSNNEGYLEYVNEFDGFIKCQTYYETDYMLTMDKQVYVVKLPNELYSCIDSFMMGKYTQMFSKEQVNKYFKFVPGKTKSDLDRNERIQQIRNVLLHDNAYAQIYLNKINKEYDTTFELEDVVSWEFDAQPDLKNEILNY